MGVTANGIHYPEPADPVNQGAAAMRTIAEEVTALPTTGGVAAAAALSPAAFQPPAKAPIRIVAGKVDATTDATGKYVLTFPTFTTAVLSVQICSAVGGVAMDQVFSIAARTANSVTVFVVRAGASLPNTTIGTTYIAVGY